jgi:hypothetical protein
MESTARQKASARPSSSVTVGRRCAGAHDGLVIGGARRIGGDAAIDGRRKARRGVGRRRVE